MSRIGLYLGWLAFCAWHRLYFSFGRPRWMSPIYDRLLPIAGAWAYQDHDFGP